MELIICKRTVRLHDLLPKGTFTADSKIKAFVVKVDSKTYPDIGMWVSNHGLILRRNNTVTIGIHKNQVARLGTALQETMVPIGNLLSVLENTCCFVAIEIANGIARLNTPYRIGTLRNNRWITLNRRAVVTHLGHFIGILGDVEISTVSEASHIVVPTQAQLNTSVFHIACIDVRCFGTHNIGNRCLH